MNRERALRRLAAIALVLLLPCATSCATLALGGLGSVLDHALAHRQVTLESVRELRPETQVRLLLRDGTRLEGSYLGLALTPGEGPASALRFRAGPRASISSVMEPPDAAGERVIPLADIREIRHSRQLGWSVALLPVGAAIDLFLLSRALSHYD